MRRPPPAAIAALAATLFGAGAACSPARRRAAAASLPAALAAAARANEAVAAAPPPWADPFLGGRDGLGRLLAPSDGDRPREAGGPAVVRLFPLEAYVRDRAREEGRRDVRTLFAFRAASRSVLPPSRCADAILDAAREKASLDADDLTELARGRVEGADRRVLSVALLRMGEGPFRYDFRWAFLVDRLDRSDGSVLLRYERTTHFGGGEHVSVFRGLAALVPDGGGTLWTEVLLVGSDVAAPFFLASKVEGAVEDILVRRWRRLAGGG